MEGVDHRLVARLGATPGDDPGDTGAEGAGELGGVELGGRAGALGHLEEQRPVERSARTADRRHERHAAGLQHRPRVVGSTLLEPQSHGGGSPGHVRAVVGVADRGVELGQEFSVLDDLLVEPHHPRDQVIDGEAAVLECRHP